MKVTLLQRAVPLPVGGAEETGAGAAAPVPEHKPLLTAPPQPRPKLKRVVKKPPAVIVAPAPIDTPQLAMLTLPSAPGPVTDEAASDLSGGSITGNGGEGAGGSGDKSGAGAGGGPGQGGGCGISARPDYGVNPKPPYPLIARRLGAQGVVLLRVQVRKDGTVATVELARSSGFALLDESASRTVRERWRFLPARLDGTPVASWVEVPIRFVLEDS